MSSINTTATSFISITTSTTDSLSVTLWVNGDEVGVVSASSITTANKIKEAVMEENWNPSGFTRSQRGKVRKLIVALQRYRWVSAQANHPGYDYPQPLPAPKQGKSSWWAKTKEFLSQEVPIDPVLTGYGTAMTILIGTYAYAGALMLQKPNHALLDSSENLDKAEQLYQKAVHKTSTPEWKFCKFLKSLHGGEVKCDI